MCAVLYTVGPYYAKSRMSPTHNHDSGLGLIKLASITSAAKKKNTYNICSWLAKIMHSVIENEGTSAIFPKDLNYIKRNMYNARRLLPKLPKVQNSVHCVLSLNSPGYLCLVAKQI